MAADRDFGIHNQPTGKRRRRWTILLMIAFVIGAGYFWLLPQRENIEEEEVLIAEIRFGDIENSIPASGTLMPKEIVPIGARASGELIEIYVEVGDFVEEGDVVAQIDAEEQVLRVESSRLSLENQRNQIAQREIALRNAKNSFERTTRLRDVDASTAQDLETAENNLINAQTSLDNLLIQIKQSETNLEQEEVQLRYTEIKAPLSGTIISLDQKEGATLNASRTAPTVMQIADLTTLTVETEISEADIQELQTGVDVYFTTLGGGDRRWYGKLRKIDPMGSVQNNVVLFNGSFDVDNSDGELFPNMSTEVFFVTSSARNVLTVPMGALTFTGTPIEGGQISGRQHPEGSRAPLNLAGSIRLNEPRNATVELLQTDGVSFEIREVVVGATDRFNAEVISGLAAGDQVITSISYAELEEEVDAVTSASW